jgi:hypothetical protein
MVMERKNVSLMGIVLIVAALLFAQCSHQTKVAKSCLNPAFENVDIDFKRFIVSADEGGILQMESGTTITIPANAFVNASGKKIVGDVDIDFREFNSAFDILIAGAPMHYDSAGQSYFFETAGMFDINGYQNNEEIFIADNASITVSYASDVQGDFNFYALNEETGDWTFINGDVKSEENPNAVPEVIPGIEKPIVPEIAKSGARIIDINVNYNQYPDLKVLEGLMWEYAGTSPEHDPDNNKWIYEKQWVNIEIVPQNASMNVYKMELSEGSSQFNLYVKPVLSEKEYEKMKSVFEKQMADYSAARESFAEAQKKYVSQRALLRTFQINSFGIYNWDVIYSRPGVLAVRPEFLIDGKKLDPNQVPVVNLVTASNRALFAVQTNNNGNIIIDPFDNNMLIAVLPGNKIAVMNNNQIHALRLNETVANNSNAKVVFNLQTQSDVINSSEDFDRIVKSM